MNPLPRLDQPANYHIQILGGLAAGWSEHFGGMEVTTQKLENGQAVTSIRGIVPDQAGLHGILRSIRDLGLPLILVEWVQPS